ncbi:hypothetical protein [Wolinella succinogenes]|uniref:hypothetical protein n=1 Tax=Wolinella succinogenes TaxID=844 RepID=UPI00240A17A6|nr:hypothetical protein [Wolinella succinogenes]
MTLKECNLIVLDKPRVLSSEQEVYLVDQFGLFFVHHSFESLLSGFKSHPIDMILVFLEALGGSESLSSLKAIKGMYPEIPILLATDIAPDEIDKAIPFALAGMLPVAWRGDRFSEVLKSQESFILRYAKKERDRRGDIAKELSIEESIARFFSHTKEKLAAFDLEAESGKRFNYPLMKRFIHTAYNNFIEIDPKIRSIRKLTEAKDRLSEALRLQILLKKRIDVSIEYNYEEVYLKNQPAYIEVTQKLEQTLHKMAVYRKEMGILTSQMERFKEEMKHASDPSKKMEAEQSFKNANRRYVDRMHEIKQMQESLGVMEATKEEIWKRDFEAFVEVFKEEAGKYEREYEELVDALAYRFDRFLWIAARESRLVREYFEKGMIEGVFSSKTYLEYYVKHLDKNLSSKANRELIRYRHKMEEENAIRVALVGNVTEDLLQDKRRLEATDGYIRVSLYVPQTLENFFEEAKEGKYEIVMMEDVVGRWLFFHLWKRLKESLVDSSFLPKRVLLVRHYKDPNRIREKALSMRWENILTPPITREKLKALLLSIA